jgi:hypothetical protein
MATLRPGRTSARHRFSSGAENRFGEHHFDAASGLFITPTARTRRWGPRFFTFAAEGSARVEARGDYAAVIEDEQVAFAQMPSKTRERIVLNGAGCAIHHQHAARAALGRWLLRNQFLGEFVVEVGDTVLRTFTFWSRVFRHWRKISQST